MFSHCTEGTITCALLNPQPSSLPLLRSNLDPHTGGGGGGGRQNIKIIEY